MRQRWIAAVVVAVCAMSSALLARQGTVITKDNNQFEGDIAEDKGAGTVTVMMHGVPYGLKMANVQSIIYTDEVEGDVRQKLAQLGPRDIKGRLALAQYALDHHAPAAARDVLVDAQKIDPNNPDVRDMLERVKAQLRATEPPTTRPSGAAAAPPGPATAPAAAAPQPMAPPTSRPAAGGKLITRTVTPDEINLIRQWELRDGDSVRAKIDAPLRKRFTEYVDMPLAEFDHLSQAQQAFMILDKGRPDMKREVKILSDPPAVLSFKRNVERTLLQGCATSKCHGGNDAAAFRLFQGTDAATYTNLVVLQQFVTQAQGRKVFMLDRQNPDQSLILSYVLPPASADLPHPDAKAYHGAVRGRTDPRLASIQQWLQNDLNPVTPPYTQIDLSAPPATQPSAAQATGKP